MQNKVIDLLLQYQEWAMVISIVINILISTFGFIPSVFLTAANITVFGFWEGTLISFIGESFGAVVAFYLYRKGFKRITEKVFIRYPKLNALLEATGKRAFILILSFRLLPFIPSGIVTFVAAIGNASPLIFFIASSIGKIPALLMEAFMTNELMQWSNLGKIIVVIIALFLMYLGMKGRGK